MEDDSPIQDLSMPIVSSQEVNFQRNSNKSPELHFQIRPSFGEIRGDSTTGDYFPRTNVIEPQNEEGINADKSPEMRHQIRSNSADIRRNLSPGDYFLHQGVPPTEIPGKKEM